MRAKGLITYVFKTVHSFLLNRHIFVYSFFYLRNYILLYLNLFFNQLFKDDLILI